MMLFLQEAFCLRNRGRLVGRNLEVLVVKELDAVHEGGVSLVHLGVQCVDVVWVWAVVLAHLEPR